MTEQAASAAGTPDAARAWHGMTAAEALAAQGVDAATGLTDAEVEARRAKFGSEQVRRGGEGAALAGVPAPVPRPDADRAARWRASSACSCPASSRPASC